MAPTTMTLSFALALLPAVAAIDGTQFAQLIIQRRVVIRVPVVPLDAPPPRPVRLIERKGPKCLATSQMGGALVSGPRMIDIYMRGGARTRAMLDGQCNAIDLRFGFYIRPNRDGNVCADRDSIHARTGAQCNIERFRSLVPER